MDWVSSRSPTRIRPRRTSGEPAARSAATITVRGVGDRPGVGEAVAGGSRPNYCRAACAARATPRPPRDRALRAGVQEGRTHTQPARRRPPPALRTVDPAGQSFAKGREWGSSSRRSGRSPRSSRRSVLQLRESLTETASVAVLRRAERWATSDSSVMITASPFSPGSRAARPPATSPPPDSLDRQERSHSSASRYTPAEPATSSRRVPRGILSEATVAML